VIKSVLALVVGIMLVLSSAAGYAYVRLTMTDETPTETTADTGVAACEALLALPERNSLDDLFGETIVTGLLDSANAELQAAGSTIEALSALPADQQAAAAPQLATILSQLGAGCEALGVTIPEPSGSASPSP
jgi:hypothetical protein